MEQQSLRLSLQFEPASRPHLRGRAWALSSGAILCGLASIHTAKRRHGKVRVAYGEPLDTGQERGSRSAVIDKRAARTRGNRGGSAAPERARQGLRPRPRCKADARRTTTFPTELLLRAIRAWNASPRSLSRMATMSLVGVTPSALRHLVMHPSRGAPIAQAAQATRVGLRSAPPLGACGTTMGRSGLVGRD